MLGWVHNQTATKQPPATNERTLFGKDYLWCNGHSRQFWAFEIGIMKKCKTCKYWSYQGFNLGDCSGIRASSIVIPIPNQPKGKPNGKLIVKSGIATNGTFIKTPGDWNCKNWMAK